MQAAEHGANFPMAEKLRQTMTHAQLHDFAVGSEAGKPQHVKPAAPKSNRGANLGKFLHPPKGKKR